ncbi:MAG: triose-phosphate isomerase [Bacteroidales bacterium]|nr:triose-phosphate isomerase [Bacteroidales bacterium]
MRKKIVAGNWKMNKTFQDAEELVSTIAEELDGVDTKCEVVLCPPFPYLEMASDYADESGLQIAAQNVSEYTQGAYTGEVSADMLASIEIGYCIVGHSERRKYFGETNAQLALKVENLLEHAIKPIFCVGELLDERNSNSHFEVVKQQLSEGLFQLNEDEFSEVVVAYEPVWAIGTGVTATSAQAQEMHAYIRQLITEKYGKTVADNTTILYGGSCNAKNAKELFANPDVDGGLIGGASLVAEDFIKIVKSF